ncbi:MAG: creatininase family protein [Planctomycetota bacterium]
MADTMASGEMAEHRRRDGIVLLPLGCFEMHGVQVGMGCDTFEALAACRVLAQELDAVVMPPIHYTFAGATGPWPGTVNLRPQEVMAYIKAVVKAILRNGFKRLILVSIHGPSSMYIRMVLREVFEETGELPILLRPNWGEFRDWVEEEFGQPHGAAASYLAALHICGRHGEFDPHADEQRTRPNTMPFDSWRELIGRGVSTPYRYVRPEDHVGQYPGLEMEDAPRCAEAFGRAVLSGVEGLPEAYEKFQADMRRALKEAPWDDYDWPERDG